VVIYLFFYGNKDPTIPLVNPKLLNND